MKLGWIAVKLIWAVLSDMLFGKYQFAEYLRRRKFTTVTILALIAATGAFFWMLEQSLIHAGLARQAQEQLAKYNPKNINDVIKQEDDAYNLRIRLICRDNYSKYCSLSDIPTKSELCRPTDPVVVNSPMSKAMTQ